MPSEPRIRLSPVECARAGLRRPGPEAWIRLAVLVALATAVATPSEAGLPASFTITASAGTGGSIAPSGAVAVVSGADQVFEIAPDACYSVTNVQVDGASVGAVASYTFANVTADHTIDASFALQTPGIVVTSDINPSSWGQAVTFTATVTPSAATGTITFKDSLTTLGTVALSGGTAQLVKSNLSPGNHTSITATYSGDACYGVSTSPAYAQLVHRRLTTMTLTSDTNPSAFAQSVTLTATVSPAGATGRVTFYVDGNPTGTATVNALTGVAALNVDNLLPGSHTLTAGYPGDVHYVPGASGVYNQVVNPVPTTVDLGSDSNPAACRQTVTLTASLTPSDAEGTVEFLDGATSLGTATAHSGVATLALSTLAVGAHTLNAQYSGDVIHAANAAAPYALTVDLATPGVVVTTDIHPSVWGQEVAFYATITPSTASGTVTFKDSLSTLGIAPVAGGIAEIFKSNLYTGNHTAITAVYSGDACYATTTSAAYSQLVTRVTSTVSLVTDLNPSSSGDNVRMWATVSPLGSTGRVTFYVDGNPIGTAAVDALNGLATLYVGNLVPGSHTLTARYPGDSHSTPGTSAAYTQVVNAVSSTTALGVAPSPSLCHETVTLTATVTPSEATGTVVFSDGATTLGSAPVSSGVATLAVSTLTTGTHSISAGYSGDTFYTGSTATPQSQTVHPATPAVDVTSDINSSTRGEAVTFTASMTPSTASGTITFKDSLTTLGTAALSGGTAQLVESDLTTGNHTAITAVYSGDACFSPQTSAAYSQLVGRAPSSLALVTDVNPSESGEQVKLTATPSPSDAGGSVTFFDGGAPIGSAPISAGVATLAVSSLAISTHSLTAGYGGDADYTASTSAPYMQDVVVSLPPVVDVTWPNGGEDLNVASIVTLTWTATDNSPVVSVTLDVSRDNGTTWARIATDIPNSGSYAWTVPTPGTNTNATPVYSALFRVAAMDSYGVIGYDTSNSGFSLFDTQVPVTVTELGAETLDDGIRLRWSIANRGQFTRLELQRSPAEVGPWAAVNAELEDDAGVTVATDRTVEAGQTYYYRLAGTTSGGAQLVFGLMQGTAGTPKELSLSAVWPNPTPGPLSMRFALPREAHVKLSVLDLQGREIVPLIERSYRAGRYQVDWDGRTDRGIVPAGLYFVQLATPDAKVVRRVAIAR